MTRRPSTWTLRAAALAAGVLAPLVCAELALRLLPVYEGMYRLPVDDRHPIARLQPHREFTWSRGWNFFLVNTVQVNNAGFVSDVDYEPDAPGPLLAVIGDSYVEAAMLPFRRTCAGRLATMLEPDARVYAFGLSSAAFGQYLAWARHARDVFRPDGLVVVIAHNDYEHSLFEYGRLIEHGLRAGYHYLAERGGRPVLERIDFSPSPGFRLARSSALVRYLAHNLATMELVRRNGTLLLRDWKGVTIDESKQGVDAFLDLLPEYSGLDPERIVLVVDGIRRDLYDDERLAETRGSFVDVMRRHLLANAGRKGYETIDMQPRFIAHYREHRQRFEWPQDEHWNALGHERCFEAVAGSKLLSAAFPAP